METKKIRVLLAQSTDPYLNLATENWIFRDLPADTHVLFLWQNQETVVIGRFQNPWSECNLEKMKEDGVLLTRRQSGGGAVFHDLGNTCFTFLSPRNSYDKMENMGIITRALGTFGIESYFSGRNDILINDNDNLPRKISGSAFKENFDRCFHHGTLLVNSDLEKLGQYLTPKKLKLKSKAISSVRSRVANLSDFNPGLSIEKIHDSIIQEFFEFHKTECPIEVIDQNTVLEVSSLKEYYDWLKSDEWKLGETPAFDAVIEEKFDWGHVEVHLNTHKGKITELDIFSDGLRPELFQEFKRQLVGVRLDRKDISSVAKAVTSTLPEVTNEAQELGDWLGERITGW